MKIGVISDTHSDLRSLKRAVKVLGEVDAWFHLGDLTSDVMSVSDEIDKPIYAVRGNCDYSKAMPLMRIVELGGKRFFLTHGHEYAVNAYTTLLTEAAREAHCDAAIYGHTHIPLIEYGPVWVLNPGSTSRPKGGSKPSCALINIDDDKMHFEIIDL